jgi:hypothetical protein
LTRPIDEHVGTSLLPEQARLRIIRLPAFTLRRVAKDQWEFQGETASAMEATDIARLWESAAAAALQSYAPATNPLGHIELLLDGPDAPILFDILEIPGKPDFILGRADAGLQYHFAPDLGRQLLGEDAHARTP